MTEHNSSSAHVDPAAPATQAPRETPALELAHFERRSPAAERRSLTGPAQGARSNSRLAHKRSWKTRFLKSLSSAPAIFVIATIIAPGLLLGLRKQVVTAVPPTAMIYAAVGLPVNLDGLELRNVTSVLKEQGNSKHLLVKGEIVNIRKTSGTLPNLDLALLGPDGREVYTWQAPSPQKRLASRAAIKFRARLESPPAAAKKVVVRFAGKKI